MNYELVKELKAAGFPNSKYWDIEGFDERGFDENGLPEMIECVLPSLSELIKACKNFKTNYWFEASENPISKKWSARLAKYPSSNKQHYDGTNDIYLEIGSSLEEAVARLWLRLNSN